MFKSRQPERIPIILAELQKVWQEKPDLRLCQLMNILAKTYGDWITNDLFYLEDHDLKDAIEKFKKVHCIK